MIKPSILGRGALAVLVSLLAVGTVLATSPAPSSSAGSSHAFGAPPVQTAGTTAKPTESPEATETAEPAETAEPGETAEPAEASGATLTDSQAAPFVAKLKAAGIVVSVTEFKALAAKVGGAVRVAAFAKASGKSTADILAMFQGGKGWGEIAHTLGLHPGIGWIMSGGHGKGQGHAAGADKTKGADDSGS